MIMIQQLIQYMVYQINIDLVYDIQFETNITKMDEKLITKQFVKDPSGQCKRENQRDGRPDCSTSQRHRTRGSSPFCIPWYQKSSSA